MPYELYYLPATAEDESTRQSYTYIDPLDSTDAAGLWSGFGTVQKQEYYPTPEPGEDPPEEPSYRWVYPIGHTHIAPTPAPGECARFNGTAWEYFGGSSLDTAPDPCSFCVEESAEFVDFRMFHMHEQAHISATGGQNAAGWDGHHVLGAGIDRPIHIEMEVKILSKEEFEEAVAGEGEDPPLRERIGKVDGNVFFMGATGGKGKQIAEPVVDETPEQTRERCIEEAQESGGEEEDEPEFLYELTLYRAIMQPMEIFVGGDVGIYTIPPWHRYEIVFVPKVDSVTKLLEPYPIGVRLFQMYPNKDGTFTNPGEEPPEE